MADEERNPSEMLVDAHQLFMLAAVSLRQKGKERFAGQATQLMMATASLMNTVLHDELNNR